MIIFYEKETGLITGTINGRTNSKEELSMCVGDPATIDKIVIFWEPTITKVDKEGNSYQDGFVPIHPQPEIFVEAETKPMSIYDYKVDTITKKFVKLD